MTYNGTTGNLVGDVKHEAGAIIRFVVDKGDFIHLVSNGANGSIGYLKIDRLCATVVGPRSLTVPPSPHGCYSDCIGEVGASTRPNGGASVVAVSSSLQQATGRSHATVYRLVFARIGSSGSTDTEAFVIEPAPLVVAADGGIQPLYPVAIGVAAAVFAGVFLILFVRRARAMRAKGSMAWRTNGRAGGHRPPA